MSELNSISTSTNNYVSDLEQNWIPFPLDTYANQLIWEFYLNKKAFQKEGD